jgi:hypothetical protein
MVRTAGRRSLLVLALLLPAAGGPAQDTSGPSLAESFREPPLDARPMVLWPWLNGHVDRDQLKRELEEMRAKGLRGAIIWDIGSLADPAKTIPAGPPFLGPESLGSIRHVLAEAERLGLEVGLVASSSWNAGGPWIEPGDASQELLWASRRLSGPAGFEDLPPRPEKLTEPAVEVALLALPADAAGEPDTAAEPLDLSARVGDDGRLRWEVPAGDWTILRFVCAGTGQPLVCPSPGSNGLIVDHLSRAATDRHFGVMLDRLFAGGERPAALKLLMLDSFEVWPRTDWTPGFAEAFEQAYGYDLRPWLPVLAGLRPQTPELGERFLHDYRALVSRMMVDHHFGRAAGLLEARGLELVAEAGHGGYPRVDALEALGAAHVPMGEFWNGSQFWVTKEAASAAHIYGRRDVAAEALTGWRHWRDGPAEFKRLFDIAFCAGLNRPVFHTFAHNPPSAGRPGYAYHAGEHFNVNATWWEQAGPMLRYLARCSQMLRQGQFVADVCFYHGDEAPSLVPARRIDPKVRPPHDPLECQHCGRPLPNRVDRLGPGHDYDYVNRDVLVRDMRTQDGRLILSSGMEYRLLVLPEREDIALPVLRKLERLVREGATLVGPRPTRSNSLEGHPACDTEVRDLARLIWGEVDGVEHRHGRGRVLPPEALGAALEQMELRPDFAVETPGEEGLDFIHRRTATEDIYLVVNGSDRPVWAECSFRVPADARPSLWNPEDGSIAACPTYRVADGAIRVPLQLPPIGSVFVVFRRGAAAADGAIDQVVDLGRAGRAAPGLVDRDVEVLAVRPDGLRVRARAAGAFTFRTAGGRSAVLDLPALPEDLAVPGPWQLRFPAGQGAPELIELGGLVSWTEFEPEGARHFAGTAVYRATLTVPEAYLRTDLALHLDLGAVAELAEVSIDGVPIDLLWKPPFRADVTRLLRPGLNHLEVRVTNLWHNRIVGDRRTPDAAPRAPTNLAHRFRADMELLPAGLLGPVVLRPVVEVDLPFAPR